MAPRAVLAARALLSAARARGSGRASAGGRAARALGTALGAEVVALVLLGSWGRRRPRGESDLDVLVVTRGPPRRDARPSRGAVDLDLKVVTLSELERTGVPPWLCGGPTPVLFDPEGHAVRAVTVARALHAAGPRALSRAEVAARRAWVARMVRRATVELRTAPAVAALRLARLRVRLLELSLEVRGQWPRADRDTVAWWRRRDPRVVEVLGRLLAPHTPAQELALLDELGRQVLAPR